MKIIESILTRHPCYAAGKRIAVKGLMLHSVGCPQPSAEVFTKKWNSAEASRACVHAFIDGNTGIVYQTLPWDYKAWHCGGNGNSSHIGVEMCEPGCIRYTGGASFTCLDKAKAMAVVERTYEAAVELFAYLCTKYKLNPLADGVIISHKEGHDRGLASGHGDPDHLWKGMHCAYSMDTFRRDVKAAMEKAAPHLSAQPAQKSKAKAAPAGGAQALGRILAGDTVSLTRDAIYYDGTAMPDWVKKDKWIVAFVSGSKAVIDRNTSKTKSIKSPVDVKYLRKC